MDIILDVFEDCTLCYTTTKLNKCNSCSICICKSCSIQFDHINNTELYICNLCYKRISSKLVLKVDTSKLTLLKKKIRVLKSI
jgi:hypothetical protein